jgi:hypothetical protein
MCLNEIPQNKLIQSLISRTLFYRFELSFVDKLLCCYEIAKLGYKDLSKEDCIKVVDWIRDNVDETAENFNFRTLIHLFNLYRYDKNSFEKLAMELLQVNPILKLIKELMKNYASVKEQVKEFITSTGLSRATFFRYKAILKKRSQSLILDRLENKDNNYNETNLEVSKSHKSQNVD